MISVGIDVSKGKSTVCILKPYGEIVASPFEKCGVDEVIGEALEKTVPLKSGGRITIEETRACVAIDVDSSRDAGGGSLNRLNEEAALEIVRQIRLRNLAGKIVVDFAGHSEFTCCCWHRRICYWWLARRKHLFNHSHKRWLSDGLRHDKFKPPMAGRCWYS